MSYVPRPESQVKTCRVCGESRPIRKWQRMCAECEQSFADKSAVCRVPVTDQERINNMVAAYKGGVTMTKIGESYGITRERVRQLLKKHSGMTRLDGGKSILKRQRNEACQQRIEAQYLREFGMTRAQVKALGGGKIKLAFNHQAKSAIWRGIGWELTFEQWWRIWVDSGKWLQRGRNADSYVMARMSDTGPYRVGNVYIITCKQNGQEYQRNKQSATKTICTGVYLMYPGSKHPYQAKVGKRSLGMFPTAEAAIAARKQYVDENPIRRNRGFMVTYVKKRNRFELYARDGNRYRYVKSFVLREEAETRGYQLCAVPA